MSVQQLGKDDQALVRRCLEFILSSTELAPAFETRLGVTESEIRELLDAWPHVDDAADDSTATIAVNNALNEIVNGIRVTAADERRLGGSRGAVQALYWRWARARGWSATGLR